MQPKIINNRYQIDEKISQTYDVSVYKGYDLRLKTEIAIKILNTEELSPEGKEEERRFSNEARLLSAFNHPNIVKVLDHGKSEHSLFMVMPFLPGGTLADRLTKPIPYKEAAALLLPIADALIYCHAHEIIHRDLKPSNIIVTATGVPILIDFFLAKNLKEDSPSEEETGFIGTVAYAAPEQWLENVTFQSDIYSLGIIFYEMVAGNNPLHKQGITEHLTKPHLDNPNLYVSNLPKMVSETILKATSLHINERFQNMEEFKTELVKISKTKETLSLKPNSSTQQSGEAAMANDNNPKNPLGGLLNFFKTSQSALNFAKTIAEIVDDLLLPKAGAIEKIAASQIKILSKYYALALEQADRSFKAAMFWASVGLVAFIGALIFLLTNQSRDIAVLSAIAGALVEVISGINFYLYNRASGQLVEFRDKLDVTQKILMANSICEKIQGDYKQRTRSLIALKAAGIEIPLDEHYFEKPKPPEKGVHINALESSSLETEHVVIENASSQPTNLQDWMLSDQAKHKYPFPEFILEPNKTVKVWTKVGDNDSANLYWGRQISIWNDSGDCAYLRDNNGKLINKFSYKQ